MTAFPINGGDLIDGLVAVTPRDLTHNEGCELRDMAQIRLNAFVKARREADPHGRAIHDERELLVEVAKCFGDDFTVVKLEYDTWVTEPMFKHP